MELLHKLYEWCKEAVEKYLSHFTMDRHQKIIHQREIDMESLLPPLQALAVSAPNLSLTTFMEQRGDQLKQYLDESIKCIYIHTRNQLLLVFPRMSLIWSTVPNTSDTNGSPLAQP